MSVRHAVHPFGWCAAEYAAGYDVVLDPGVAMVLGSALWLGAVRDGVTVDPVPAREDDTLCLSGVNPRAMEVLADSLRAPLLIYRQRDAGQLTLLRKRAAGGRRTLVTVSARLFDDAAPALRTTPALVDAVRGEGDDECAVVRGGPSLERTVPIAELLGHWLRPDGPVLDTEWFVFMPAAPGAVAPVEAWPLVVALALTRLRTHLAAEADSTGAPAGTAVLRRLVADARHAGPATIAAHAALLARSTSDTLGGPGLVRHALADGVRTLAAHAEEPDALLPFAGALVAAGDAWDAVAAAASYGHLRDAARLRRAHDTLIAREDAVIESLDRTLATEAVAC